MLSTPKNKSELFLASSLRDGLEDNNIRQVTMLLKNKEADPNVLIPSYGISPFHLVIGNESERFAEEVTKLFLRHGGNPNVKAVDGMTPVHVAAAWGRVKVLELLLANGGDPLSVDDDGRTPFHYAFDGSYYDAITVLGKYCVKNQNDDEEDCDSDSDNDLKPKVEIKLEKILVNRGNIIAEYVPSDIEEINNTITSEDKENTNVDNFKRFCQIKYESSSSRSSSLTSENNMASLDDNIRINSDNITMRRPRKEPEKRSHAISPILPEDDNFDFDNRNRNESEEKVLVGKIIRRLSTSFNKINENGHIKGNILKDTKKKFPSFIPPPKIYKNNLKPIEKKKTIPSKILDTSIVSKSPNFQISISRLNTRKTPPSLNSNKYTTLKNRNSKLKTYSSTSSTSSSSSALKSASSTPRRRLHRIQNKLIEKPTRKINMNANKIQNLIHQTYSESEYDIPYISQDKKNYTKAAEKTKSIARKLHDSDNEDYGHNVDSMYKNKLKIKTNQIHHHHLANMKSKKLDNKSNTNMRLQKVDPCNSPVSKISKSIKVKPSEELKISKTPKKSNNLQFQPVKVISLKTEDCECLLQSPGSSNPTSVNSSCKSSLEIEEEMTLLDEVQEIYKAKGQTPPASVSNFDSEPSTSLENPKESSNNTEEFFDCQKVENVDVLKQSTIDVHTNKREIATKLETEQMYDSDSESFRTPMRSIISSTFSNESFVSVDEEYTYVDIEKNVAFLERRLRVIPIIEDMDKVKHESTWLDKLAELSINSGAISSKQSSRLGTNTIGNNTLRNKLISLGEIPGPITHTTYNVYLKRLRKLQQTVDLNDGLLVESSYNETRICKIPTNILKTDWMSDLTYYQDLEDQVFCEYEKPNSSKKYRGGLGKISFNYLLLDPRITKDLPRNGRNINLSDRWKRFLEAIFYIGKGKAARPAAHLYDAFDIWTGKKQVDEPSEKIQRILSIWSEGRGVVCLHVFMNTMQEEAFTREAAMIDTLGTNHLSNCSRGNYYGILSTMNTQEKRHLGKYLLYKAMEIFMFEGERQIFPRSIS